MSDLAELTDIQASVKQANITQIVGCVPSQMEHFIHLLGREAAFRVVITSDEKRAQEIHNNCRFYCKKSFLFPAKDLFFYNADIHGNYIVKSRMELYRALINGDGPITVVTTVDALSGKLLSLSRIKNSVITINSDDTLDIAELSKKLVLMSYDRVSQVSHPGEFSVRGSIIDIYSFGEDVPFRIDLWDDEIDSMKSFDSESQRSIENLDSITIYPASEYILTEDETDRGINAINEALDKEYALLMKQLKTEEAAKLKSTVTEFIENLKYSPASAPLDAYLDYFAKGETVSLLSYFEDKDTIFFLDEPARCLEKCEAVDAENADSIKNRLEKGYILSGMKDFMYRLSDVMKQLKERRLVTLTAFDSREGLFKPVNKFYIETKNTSSYSNNFDLLVSDLSRYQKQKFKVIIYSPSKTRAARLAEDLTSRSLHAYYSEREEISQNPGEIMIRHGHLPLGFSYPLIKFVVLSEVDIFSIKKEKKKKISSYQGTNISSFTELAIGDYVVHESHGIGIYRGIVKQDIDNVSRDYIKLDYADGGSLFVPADNFNRLQKYAGADARAPKLSKLGSTEWVKVKARAKAAIEEIAQDLVKLYAVRSAGKGYAFSPDNIWQQEFEETFPYTETDDQLKAINDTKQDMESDKIMDRLICGDVGYGKTEIAIRAAFKAVLDGKQVAFLVPTTILAQQHYNTFVQRFTGFAVEVQFLSRFKTAAQQKKIISEINEGKVDIIIGTHRILSQDIKFKDLGLLIIDEEQRFGVSDKEKIKKMRENIDVLTLSATPIPRTLHMSLSGIRDMSVLTEPPEDRMPIQTYILEHDEEIIREAIKREVSRGGQVYYVFNRVRGIADMAVKLKSLLPELNISYAHGRMNERELETIMYDFMEGEIDVLVSTTIIETGLDISNVNTIIIDDADNFGLSQLYQLRGRVGRSGRTAYAFMMYKRNKVLREVAEKRLQALREFTDLGSGFKIALRDLEIRGAGNLLGRSQHGHMSDIGYDLYCKLLNEAILGLKGEAPERTFTSEIDLGVNAYIPPSYIKNEAQKLEMYKRISNIANITDYEDVQDELTDRYGDIPTALNNLLGAALIKARANESYITEIKETYDGYVDEFTASRNMLRKGKAASKYKLLMYKQAPINVAEIPALIEQYKGRLKFVANDGPPYFVYTASEYKPAIDTLKAELFALFDDMLQLLS